MTKGVTRIGRTQKFVEEARRTKKTKAATPAPTRAEADPREEKKKQKIAAFLDFVSPDITDEQKRWEAAEQMVADVQAKRKEMKSKVADLKRWTPWKTN